VDEALTELAETVGRLEARPRSKRPAVVDGPELLTALVTLRRLRDRLAGWEPLLIGAAREQGLTWTEIAPALGLASRQAAERRYLRLNPQPADEPSTTREQRVRAARDRRSGDRAVAGWARDHAAGLRQLAGQVTVLHGDEALDPAARASVARVHSALGGDDVADLIDPLADAAQSLSASHPALADRIAELAQATDEVRASDRSRRNAGGSSG
jgi:hypothetical protein